MFICMQVSFRADYSQLERLVEGKGVEFNFILPTIVFYVEYSDASLEATLLNPYPSAELWHFPPFMKACLERETPSWGTKGDPEHTRLT